MCSAWGDGRIYHDWKTHWPSNPALKTSSYLAQKKREKERSVFVHGKGGLLQGRNRVLAAWGGRMSSSEGQAFILEKQAPSFSSAHGRASSPSPPPAPFSFVPFQPAFHWGRGAMVPALLVALSPPRTQCPSVTCWWQSSWQRRVKLEAGFLFPNLLRCCPAGKPWHLQFPTLQLARSFCEFPKCFARSQNTCSVNSDPCGNLAEKLLLDWYDFFFFLNCR